MGDLINRNQRLDVPCSKCGYKLKESIRRLEQNPRLTCPGCGSTIQVNANELRDSLRQIERELARFPKEIKIKF